MQNVGKYKFKDKRKYGIWNMEYGLVTAVRECICEIKHFRFFRN